MTMDYKERLRLAKEALESGSYDKDTIEYIFPELKESEDERIRKSLIDFHKSTMDINGIKGGEILAWLEKQGEQKPAWSEEDEKMYTATIFALAGFMGNEDKLEWLNSIKDRVQSQLSKEWSEEDEEMFNRCIKTMKGAYYQDGKALRWLENRFKSLVLQNNWKPSDEQMNTLEYYMHTLTCNEHKEILFGLYTDLKKLKE